MPSIFAKIIAGEIPCYKLYEDDHSFAFLDIFPLQRGQILIVSKKEVDHFFDLEEPYYQAIFATAKKISPHLKKVTGCKRVGLLIEGLEVSHVHIKLIPFSEGNDLDYGKRYPASEVELKEVQGQILFSLTTDGTGDK